MPNIHIYFRKEPPKDRFLPGDRYLVSVLKKLFKKRRLSGVEKVFASLCRAFDELQVPYDVNLPFRKIRPGEPVVVLGNGRYSLKDYDRTNPVIAGIGLMTHPAEWPNLFTDYPVAVYLQHSKWAKNIYARTYGDIRCAIWPAGIDTHKWAPSKDDDKKFDVLIYNKIMWDKEKTAGELKAPIIKKLEEAGLSFNEIVYGHYTEEEYRNLLQQSRAMLFLCEHESQGFALQEALSMNVPVLAWDQGFWLDPHRFKWGENEPVPASSVPYFDGRCGIRFTGIDDFEGQFSTFWTKIKGNVFQPREYVLEHLTLKKSAQIMLDIIKRYYP